MNLFRKTVELEGKFKPHVRGKPSSDESDWDLVCTNGDCFQVKNDKAVPEDSWGFFEVKASILTKSGGEQLIKILEINESSVEVEEEIDFGMAH